MPSMSADPSNSPSPVYLDYAATTPLWPEVAESMAKDCAVFGNPSSRHQVGRQAANRLQEARERVARVLEVEPDWVIFTHSATESDNLALLGSLQARQQSQFPPQTLHLLCGGLEHPAVKAPVVEMAQARNQSGEALVDVDFIYPDGGESLEAKAFTQKLRPDTFLVTMMYVHNELGLCFPVAEVAKALREHGALLHCDAVQAVGKFEIRPQVLGVDLLTLTAHKFGGPKGIGLLVRDPKIALRPQLFGGGQEQGLCAGTENVALAQALALALELSEGQREQNLARYAQFRRGFIEALRERAPQVRIIGAKGSYAPHILSFCVPGRQGAQMVDALDELGICVSSGSACHSHGPGGGEESAARRVGVPVEMAAGMLRLSFGPATTADDLERALSALLQVIA